MTGFVALIPARLASTRLPNKPLADIAGKPMVIRVAERAVASGASSVAIATDALEVAATAEAAGFRAVLTRADHPSGTDRLAEAVTALGLADDVVVVNVQGDEPLIPPTLIAAVVDVLRASTDCAMATAAHPISTIADYLSPNVVKVVCDLGGHALYFSRAPLPWVRDAMPSPTADPATRLPAPLAGSGLPLRHVGLYAYRAGFLRAYPGLTPAPFESLEMLEQLRALWHGHRIAVHRAAEAPPAGVDTPEDLARVREAFSGKHGVPR